MSKRNSKAEAGTPPLVSDPSGEATETSAETFDDEGIEEEQEQEAGPPSFPPYPPYVMEPAPLCVADHVDHGNEMRREHKSKPQQRVKPYPRMAKPWGCKAGSVPMTRRQLLAHLRCLKRHGVVLTDRLTQISKPSRRTVLSKWRENALVLPPEIIVRYRTLLDADDPWSPDQAYQFFLNMRKNKRKTPCQQKKLTKREMQAICGDKRFTWARNATVAFARGIQERLCKPACFTLNGGMLRLSDIILEELCGYMSVRVPARCSNNRKARFMMEMSDKIAIWIDDILAESDDRMLMMDFDEDDEMASFMTSDSSGGGDFTDSFLNMMRDSIGEKPAFAKFSGDMLEAFKILNRAMDKKGMAPLLTHGKFNQTYKEAAEVLRQARDFHATEFDCTLAQIVNVDLTACAAKDTPKNIRPAMKEMVEICSKYIAQNAEFNKDKGEAFQLLLEAMYGKGPCQLYSHGKSHRTYGEAADDLVNAKSLETDSDEPPLTQLVSNALTTLVESRTPDYLIADMIETLDVCSRYISKKALDENERGPAFNFLIKTLEKNGNMPFTPEYPALAQQFAAAYVLKSAPSLTPREPVPDTPMTPVSLHSMERPKTPPQDSSAAKLELTGSLRAAQTSATVPENPPSLKSLPIQTSKDPIPLGVETSLKSTKSQMGTGGQAGGSLKTMLSPAPDGGGSLKTMISPQGLGQTSKEPMMPQTPLTQSQTEGLQTVRSGQPPSVTAVRSTKSQLEAPVTTGSVKSARSAGPEAAAMKSSHLIATMGPVPESAEIFNEALHHAVDAETPASMVTNMNEVVDRCSVYLAAFVRDRDLTITLLLQMMYGKSNVVLVERKKKKMTYGEGATEVQKAPFLIPFLPIKDIADEIKGKLTEDMKDLTPYELKVSMQCAIKDAAGYLSQITALNSGVAGDRYNLEFLTAVKHTLGNRPLYKYKAYGNTYAEGAKTLKFAGPLERSNKAPDLHAEIKEEMHLGMPMRIAPSVVKDLKDTIHDASKHLAHVGEQKGLAMQHLVDTMKEKGAGDFVVIQGLPETYAGGAKTIEMSPTLHNDAVDRTTYDEARKKLTQLTKDNPNSEFDPHMPGVVDEASRFLAKQSPQTHADKRDMLARFLAMKGNKIFAQEGLYKMTYKNASEELANARFGQTTAANEKLRGELLNLMIAVVPEQKTLTLLQDVIFEGSAHLADVISGRAAALKVIHDAMMSQQDKPFLKVGQFGKTHQEVAELIKTASVFGDKANPTLYGIVSNKIENLPKGKVGSLAEARMGDTTDIVSKHISRVAADGAGMSASQLAAWNASGGESQKSLSGLFLKCPLGKEGSFLSKIGSALGVKKEPSGSDKGGGGGPGGPDGGPGGPGGSGGLGGTGGGSGGSAGGAGSGGRMGGGSGSDGQGGAPGSPGGRPRSPGAQGGPGSPGAQGGHGSPGAQGGNGSLGAQGGVPGYGTAALGEGPGRGLGGTGSETGGLGGPGSGASGPGGATSGPGVPGSHFQTLPAFLDPGSGVGGPGGLGGGMGAPGSGKGGPGSGAWAPGADGSWTGGPGSPGAVGSGSAGLGGTGSGVRPGSVGRDGSGAAGGDLSKAKSKSKSGESVSSGKGSSSGRFSSTSMSDEELEENERALKMLIKKLSSRGAEMFYQQPLTVLTHKEASDWLKIDPPMHIDKSVKHSTDTARLTKKFEKKLGYLVCRPGSTPDTLQESMQDVIIESARILSEYFVSKNYKSLVHDALVSEMQKKCNEILIEVDGAAETYFFAAQRLKRANSYEVLEPCTKVSYYISKKLDELVRCRLMPRKLMGSLKEHIKGASDYLSTQVTKPDIWIEAYVCILDEMENTGSKLLFRGDIPKSYRDSATYLRGLPSFEDRIKRHDLFLNSATPLKLMMMMRDAEKKNDSVCNVITLVTKLLVSYIKLQQEYTEVLKFVLTLMDNDKTKCGIILNHGKLRKTYQDAANLLRNKNSDQIRQMDTYIDPVVARKIQIKLGNLVKGVTIPPELKEHLDDALDVVTNYLAVELLEPHTVQVCKCMNSVFVQCELWCDEILRKITRPICSCARHAAAQMSECHGHGYQDIKKPTIRGVRPINPDPCPLTVKECPAKKCAEGYDKENPCPASLNIANTYLMYSSSYDRLHSLGTVQPLTENIHSDLSASASEDLLPRRDYSVALESLLPQRDIVTCVRLEADKGPHVSWSTPKVQISDSSFHSARSSNGFSSVKSAHSADFKVAGTVDATPSASELSGACPTTSCPVSGVVSTDQMADWHALMVSFVWNIQAWRDWLQETLDRALNYRSMPPAKAEEQWRNFRKRVKTETVQWRHYNVFSRELLIRIALRYSDKVIYSPTRASDKTKDFLACQDEMLQIIEIFNRWTKWIAKTVTETDALNVLPSHYDSLSERRWHYFKEKVEECSKEWIKYNEHLKTCWEDKYWASIADWLPPRQQAGPVWVISACGAVPSGAVAAGVHGGEVCWLARTTHQNRVLPAALLPARHCCWVYADGDLHYYTKYQVMCNAEVAWVPWRAGCMRAAAVRVAPDVFVGRVLYRGNHLVGAVQPPTYRCHVVIFNRPFAFSCFELLIIASASTARTKSASSRAHSKT